MSPAEYARIRHAAVERGRRERREQGISERIESIDTTARLVALFNVIRVEYAQANPEAAND